MVEEGNRQRAIFKPQGLAGHLYWRSVAPFHDLVFGGMVRNLTGAAGPPTPGSQRAMTGEVRRPQTPLSRWEATPVRSDPDQTQPFSTSWHYLEAAREYATPRALHWDQRIAQLHRRSHV